MKILVKRYIAIGDVLWTTPILRALKAADPSGTVHVSTARPVVFRGSPYVDAVLEPFCPEDGYDRVIDLNGAYERRRHLHIGRAYAEEAGIAVSDPRPQMMLEPGDYARITASLRQRDWQGMGVERIVAVHMAATSPDRIWPKQHWGALLDRVLANPRLGLVVLGGGRDFRLETAGVAPETARRTIDLVRETSLHETAAALVVADVLIGPDSGVGHVAASVGCRSVILHGMTDPSRYMPMTGSGEAVWSPVECRGCIADLPPDAPPRCWKGESHCYEAIMPDSVEEALGRALKAAEAGPRWEDRLELALA